MKGKELNIWEPIGTAKYKTKYVSVYVSKRNVYLTYKCREDVLVGDMVRITIREPVEEYEPWEPVPYIGEVVEILDDAKVEKLKKMYWFDDIKLAVVCGREHEE